jgi:hypothetical protein
MKNKRSIDDILAINWLKLSDSRKTFLSITTAIEFSQSLRLAQIIYPNHQGLVKLCEEELMTNNIQFEDYNEIGDHADFLLHFTTKNPNLLCDITAQLHVAAYSYHSYVGKLTAEERAMTIFSREKELPAIFKSVRKAPIGKEYAFYDKYLTDHITLDSQDGGHADIVSTFPLNEEVIERYYKERYKLYQSAFD